MGWSSLGLADSFPGYQIKASSNSAIIGPAPHVVLLNNDHPNPWNGNYDAIATKIVTTSAEDGPLVITLNDGKGVATLQNPVNHVLQELGASFGQMPSGCAADKTCKIYIAVDSSLNKHRTCAFGAKGIHMFPGFPMLVKDNDKQFYVTACWSQPSN